MTTLILTIPSHTGHGVDLYFPGYPKDGISSDSIWFINEDSARNHVRYLNSISSFKWKIKVERK